MNQIKYGVLIFLVSGWLVSCKTSEEVRQQLIYFKNLKDSSLKAAEAYEPLIQKGDILGITANGDILEREAAEPILTAINKSVSSAGTGSGSGSGVSSGDGYLVNATGSITVPFIGAVQAEGLTKLQVAQAIREKLTKEIVNPVVDVRILNFKVTLLGEVGNPGPVQVSNDKLTILDAIGAAGDLTAYGKRDNIMIIRDNNGQKEIGHLNLNDGNIFTSPYYFLKQNDVVYVELNKFKVPQEQNRTLSYIQLGLAVVTSISLLINLFK